MVREADAQTQDANPRIAALALGGTLAILALALGWAHHVGAGGDTILGGLAAPIEGGIALGGALLRSGGAALALVRGPLLLAGIAWQLLQVWRGEAEPAPRRLLGAIGLAAVGHSYCLDGRLAVGFATLGFAATSLVVARGPRSPGVGEPGAARVLIALLAPIAVYAALCSYRLDVDPPVYADEMAYHEAARMNLGQIERGGSPFWDWKGYTFERFQAQLAPLLLQSAALLALSPGLLSIRLASLATVAVALMLAALALRRRLGARVAAWMLALACVSPLCLTYGRTGFYVAASILHSVASFAVLLRFVERGDRVSGALLGGLLGAALYFYQLSWFVPILAALSLAACALGRWDLRRFLAPGPVAAVALSAALVLAPAFLLLPAGLADVARQTFDHRSALRAGAAELPHPQVVVRSRGALGRGGLEEIRARLAPLRARARVLVHEGGVTTLRVSGPRDRLDLALAALGGAPWRVLTDTRGAFSAPSYLARMFARLFYAPGKELGAWIPVPLLNPLVAPLLLLGLASAWRRRREPAIRVLVVWVVGGALLPATVGGDAARRAALMLPFVYALAALPLEELGAWFRAGGVARRRLGGAAAALLLICVACAGGQQYFPRSHVNWSEPSGPSPRAPDLPSMVGLVKALKGAPAEVPILLPPIEPGVLGYLERIEAWPRSGHRERVSVHVAARDPSRVLALSCARKPPFLWVTEDDEAQRAHFAVLDAHFETRSEVRGAYRLIHVDAAKAGGCPGR